MDIYSLTISSGSDVFYSKGFMDVLESHLNYFRSSPNSYTIQVDAKKSHIYDGDLFGYLNEKGVDQQYHWLIMRINSLYSNSEFGPEKTTLIIPNDTEIEQIRSMYMATGSISL